MRCYSDVVLVIRDCNIPEPPDCECSVGNAVITDSKGTFCVDMNVGVEEKRVDCKNIDEWTEYYKLLNKIPR